MRRRYYEALLANLRLDIESISKTRPEDAIRLLQQVDESADLTTEQLNEKYQLVCGQLAMVLNSSYQVADSFKSMAEFWHTASLHASGQASGTYWDTYESGDRRQIESFIAREFGSETALLVNSGMSALYCALGALLSHGSKFLTHDRGYFETTDMVENIFRPRGIDVARIDLSSGLPAVIEAPNVLLAETVLNAPGCAIPNLHQLADQKTIYVIDATFTSWSFDYRDICRSVGSEKVVVVESGTKYLTHASSVGIVYAPRHLGEQIREFARRIGQQLQGRALNYVRQAEVAALRERMAAHDANLITFCNALGDCGMTITTGRSAAVAQPGSTFAQLVKEGGGGALVFVTQEPDCPSVDFDRVLDTWRHSIGDAVQVRAGFGWDDTTARSYRGTVLNQPDAPEYLRISVGLESTSRIKKLATSLANILQNETAT